LQIKVDEQEAQRLRLMITSHLDDGEFARLLYGKVADLIGPAFAASLDRAVAAGDATRIAGDPLNLFWFAHHTALMAALVQLPSVPCLSYSNAVDLERQLCEFILRGIGLNEAAIAFHLDRVSSPDSGQSIAAESA
jgi:TetR/AcrR family transcriptional regulator, transcriptional repressor of aconitase